MILEIAEIKIKENQADAFVKAVDAAVPNFKAAQGCVSFQLHREIENTHNFKLIVGWEKLEDHTKTFRESEGFTNWRNLVSEYFHEAPTVVHIEKTIDAF
jgi:quinol monooxygenase YgiN